MIVLIIAGIIMVLIAVCGFVVALPQSVLHSVAASSPIKKYQLITIIVSLFTILLCVLPMGICDIWNGTNPAHRNQYELTAEAFLDGHLYIDYDDIDERLIEMENPYDPEAREKEGVSVHWDHAFYNGHYYMYFGVVPVLLLFFPFRIISGGISLPAYIGTGLFVAGFIIGIFVLFKRITKYFFPKLPYSIYLFLSVAFSMMSVWQCVATPALYCTAISSGLCMMVWSMYFFFGAVWGDQSIIKSFVFAFFGSLFGALTFGCRPPIALANVIVLPLLVVFIKKKGFDFKKLIGLIIAALPYVIIGLSLMYYNYVRFDNPFEFGQSYQLTVADQTSLGSPFSGIFKLAEDIGNVIYYLAGFSDIKRLVDFGSILTFPIVLYVLISLSRGKVRKQLRKNSFVAALIVMMGTVLLILYMDSIWSPVREDRYRLDILWLLGMITFICIGFLYMCKQEKKNYSFVVCLFAVLTVEMSILLFLWPHGFNYTYVEFGQEILGAIGS